MPELIFQNFPASSEFRQAIAQAINIANPVDDLLELSSRLHEFEERNGLSSADFYQKYQAGALPDSHQHCIEWASVYDLFLKTKRMLESTLMRAALQPEMSELAGT
jgi:hypothetical protein